MENTTNCLDSLNLEPDNNQDLSLGDLPLFLSKEHKRDNFGHHQERTHHYSLSSPDVFEFFAIPNSETNYTQDNIMFCGKDLVLHKTEQTPETNPFIDQRNARKSFSSWARLSLDESRRRSYSETRRVSAPGSFRDQSSASSRKQKVLIGLAKIPPKMELSDIKRRQSRQAPAPMFQPADEEAQLVASSGSGDHRKGRGELTLKCGSCLSVSGAIARACFGSCLPML